MNIQKGCAGFKPFPSSFGSHLEAISVQPSVSGEKRKPDLLTSSPWMISQAQPLWLPRQGVQYVAVEHTVAIRSYSRNAFRSETVFEFHVFLWYISLSPASSQLTITTLRGHVCRNEFHWSKIGLPMRMLSDKENKRGRKIHSIRSLCNDGEARGCRYPHHR